MQCNSSAHCHDRGGRIFYSAVVRLSSCRRHLRLIARYDPRWGVFSSLFCFSYVCRLIFCISPPLPKCSQSLMRWWTDDELLKKEYTISTGTYYLVSVVSPLKRTVSIFVAFQDNFLLTMPMAVMAPCFPPPPTATPPVAT